MLGRLWVSRGSLPPARGRGRWLRNDSEQVCGWFHCVSLGAGDLLAAAIPASQAALESGLRSGMVSETGLSGAVGAWLGQPFCPRVLGSWRVSLSGLLTSSK